MNSIKYAKAIREVNVYLKGIRKEDLEKIPSNFLEFLNENTHLDISGFVTFRLSGYKKMLSELIQKVVEDIKVQQEYKEFINMLKFFVETQKNCTDKTGLTKGCDHAIITRRLRRSTSRSRAVGSSSGS